VRARSAGGAKNQVRRQINHQWGVVKVEQRKTIFFKPRGGVKLYNVKISNRARRNKGLLR
jgi:hypothetical protein